MAGSPMSPAIFFKYSLQNVSYFKKNVYICNQITNVLF